MSPSIQSTDEFRITLECYDKSPTLLPNVFPSDDDSVVIPSQSELNFQLKLSIAALRV